MAVTNYQVFKYLASLVEHGAPSELLRKARRFGLLTDRAYDSLLSLPDGQFSTPEYREWKLGAKREIDRAAQKCPPVEMDFTETLRLTGHRHDEKLRILYECNGDVAAAIKRFNDQKEERNLREGVRNRFEPRGDNWKDSVDRDDSSSRYKD